MSSNGVSQRLYCNWVSAGIKKKTVLAFLWHTLEIYLCMISSCLDIRQVQFGFCVTHRFELTIKYCNIWSRKLGSIKDAGS
jgi:hypothetical protein